MRITKCFFCSSSCYPGHGIMFVRNDARTFRFCRSKCHKNFKMKRNPRDVRWTKAYRKIKAKELSNDSIYEFEKIRNTPIKYDRKLMETTLSSIKIIGEIRSKREDQFYNQRTESSKKKRLENAKKLLKRHENLLKTDKIVPTFNPLSSSAVKKASRKEKNTLDKKEKKFNT